MQKTSEGHRKIGPMTDKGNCSTISASERLEPTAKLGLVVIYQLNRGLGRKPMYEVQTFGELETFRRDNVADPKQEIWT